MEQKEVLLKKLQEDAEIPEIVYQKAEQAFNRIHAEADPPAKKRTRRKTSPNRKKYAVFILAAVLMIGTLSVSAATYFHWNDKFKEEYQVTPEMEKKLNESNTAKEMNQFTEHDGVRFEAVQSVADNTAAIVVIKIYGSEQFPLRQRMNFRNVDVKMDGMDTLSMNAGFLESDFPDTQPDDIWNDGMTYELVLVETEEGSLLGKEIKLTFTDIIDSYEEKRTLTELPPLLASTWELNIVLDNEDNGAEYTISQQITGTEAKVNKIRMSPVSFTIDYGWKRQMRTETAIGLNGETETFEHAIDPPELMGVVLEDGTVLEHITNWSNGHYTNDDFTQYQATGTFSQFIEYENVKELIFYVENEIGMEAEKVRVPVITQ